MVSSSMGDIHSSTCEVSPQQQQQQQSSLKNSSIESLNIATQIVSNKQPQPMKHVTSVEFQKIPDAALVKNMPAIQVSNFEEVMLMKQSTLPPPPPPTPLPLPIVSTTDEVKPQLSTSNSTTTTTNHNRDDIFINEIKVTPVRETEVDKKLNSLVETLEKTRHTTGEAGRKRIAREKARALANVLTAQGETVKRGNWVFHLYFFTLTLSHHA